MDDSLTVARLTLILLRASVPNPQSLGPDYGVVILPSPDVCSQEQAIVVLEQFGGRFQLRPEVQGRNLVISPTPHTSTEAEKIRVMAETFSEGIRRLNAKGNEGALVKAIGFRESILVSAYTVERWFWQSACSYCTIAIGLPAPHDSSRVVAVLYLGEGRDADVR